MRKPLNSKKADRTQRILGWAARHRLALMIGAALMGAPWYLAYFAWILHKLGALSFWAPLQ